MFMLDTHDVQLELSTIFDFVASITFGHELEQSN